MARSPMFDETDAFKPAARRLVSCSLPTMCLVHAMTCSWSPMTVSAVKIPMRYGSLLKPSQFLPPSARRPMAPAAGPRAIVTPFALYSAPMYRPRWRVRFLFHDAPTCTPLANPDTPSVPLTPAGPSFRQSPGNPTLLTGPLLPEQPFVVEV